MKRELLLAPSLGCCSLFKIEDEIRFIDAHADFLHIDIKDGNYVKTFGVGTDFMNCIKGIVKKPMDAHLMVEHPQDFIEACAEAGAAYITPHTDCIERNAFITINKIKSLGCKAGIALNPAASLESIRYYLPLLDKVTIMIVDAGYPGQKPIVQMYDKIKTLVQWRKEMKLDFMIEADGSMCGEIYEPLYQAGADMVVLGPPALWNLNEDIKVAWGMMKEEVEKGIKSTIN
ncbi:MAG: Pentose-5-phosphate-3-epimerase [Herbinix sp.]|jgi:D-allulose-6-phosphate 3-epimerase|nr:Pentose-5-phosphate-3-epimerase [Herbinix sp.]